MITKNYSQFDNFLDCIGAPVHVEFVDNGSRYMKSGLLRDVDSFRSIFIDQAIVKPYNRLNFIGHNQAIVTILDDNGNLVYNNPHISRDYKDQSSDLLEWTKYFSGFLEDFPEGKVLDDKIAKICDEQRLKPLRKILAIEGGKVTRTESRQYWKDICTHMNSYTEWIVKPALEIMESLASGYQPELDKVCRKYGLSGWQYRGMEHIVQRCAVKSHPVIEYDLRQED